MGSELQSPDHLREVYGRGRPAATEKRMGTRSTRHRGLSQRLPTNQSAPQREERLVDVGPLVIPHAQTAKLIEPGKRPLHDPPPPAQSTPVRGATHGEPRHDMPRPQSAPNRLGIVAAIAQHTVRPPPRSPRSPWSGGIASTNAKASCESFRLAPVKRNASGTPRPSQIRWRLLPRFAQSVEFGPVCAPPYTEQLSTMARDHSRSPLRASQFRSPKCIRSQRPAPCQSRNRRQHVMPDPQPGSCGNICHGSRKRMPVRHARSGTRSLPSTVPSWWWNRKERFDEIPQRVGQQHGGHKLPKLPRPHRMRPCCHHAGFVTCSKGVLASHSVTLRYE
jgi:hypothetical protein